MNEKLENFVINSLAANNFSKPEIQPLTYKSFEGMRVSPKLLDMDKAQKNFKKILKTPTEISDTEAEGFIL